MILDRFVFGLRKTLNGCSAEQETVGMTLRMTTTFSKFQGALSPKNLDETIILWDTFILK